MELDIFQVDAFTRGPFTGNPAAVVPLQEWLDDHILQSIAEENNLSETAYFVRENDSYHIRWFTPGVEVQLCGHATLASAHVLFTHLGYEGSTLRFNSLSGPLTVINNGDDYNLNFLTDDIKIVEPVPLIERALGITPSAWYQGRDDYMLILNSKNEVINLKPDYNLLAQSGGRGCLVTAQGDGEFDFVSRGFFPQTGVNEDPATGSAHTSLTPYWSKRLGKKELNACQLSARKGYFHCVDNEERTQISGECNDYLIGKISI